MISFLFLTLTIIGTDGWYSWRHLCSIQIFSCSKSQNNIWVTKVNCKVQFKFYHRTNINQLYEQNSGNYVSLIQIGWTPSPSQSRQQYYRNLIKKIRRFYYGYRYDLSIAILLYFLAIHIRVGTVSLKCSCHVLFYCVIVGFINYVKLYTLSGSKLWDLISLKI